MRWIGTDISVDLKMTLHWREPAFSAADKMHREQAQRTLDHKAHQMAERIRELVKHDQDLVNLKIGVGIVS